MANASVLREAGHFERSSLEVGAAPAALAGGEGARRFRGRNAGGGLRRPRRDGTLTDGQGQSVIELARYARLRERGGPHLEIIGACRQVVRARIVRRRARAVDGRAVAAAGVVVVDELGGGRVVERQPAVDVEGL